MRFFISTASLKALLHVYNEDNQNPLDYAFKVKSDPMAELIQMCENTEFKYSNFCTTCLVRKPLRSKHCPACNHCVAKFEHHCPWVDNCIDVSNHYYSITFLTSGTIMLCILFYDGIMFFR